MAEKKKATKNAEAKSPAKTVELKSVNKNMSFGRIISSVPESGMIMSKYGLHCIGCMFAYDETVEEGCKAHGFDEKTIDSMIKEINEFIKKKTKK